VTAVADCILTGWYSYGFFRVTGFHQCYFTSSRPLLLFYIYYHLLVIKWWSSSKSRSQKEIKAIYPSTFTNYVCSAHQCGL